MSLTDGLLLAVAVLVAVKSLVGMMRTRSNRLVEEVQKQVNLHNERERERKRRARRKAAMDNAA